ncbi:hypothetical protein HF1_09200 [Mycoplasma haemofelis str. Langford 1]|uniref:Uncharacterized protein n=1 Tax=Mycoplasma haemofelis (strain Langford 1) TaxID=941640 RepID=E8ZIF7_MYCHL|nr:hypothetical protein [Mycoplasma haemofelis]CBY92928.1 hypothetical protein HF1_09200 [Mycoplasma haemofelis str. Langford 1]
MPSKLALASLSALGAGTVATGGALYLSSKKDSLLSKLHEKLKDKEHMKILSSKEDSIWSSWKEFYGLEKEALIYGIDKGSLPEWCEKSLLGNDESKLDLASRWCVVNTRSIKEELESGSKEILGDSANWESEWESYNTKKGDLGIEDDSFKGVTQKDKGGPALKAWCTTSLSKRMYEFFEGGKGYEKVSKWCVKSS